MTKYYYVDFSFADRNPGGGLKGPTGGFGGALERVSKTGNKITIEALNTDCTGSNSLSYKVVKTYDYSDEKQKADFNSRMDIDGDGYINPGSFRACSNHNEDVLAFAISSDTAMHFYNWMAANGKYTAKNDISEIATSSKVGVKDDHNYYALIHQK